VAPGDPISAALQQADPDVRTYDRHLTFLAHPFLEGRLPGTRGMELASEYVEAHLKQAGLQAPFASATGVQSYRQEFELASVAELESQSLVVEGVELVAGRDYTASSLGKSGEASGPVTFVGYSIKQGPREHEDYASYAAEDSLQGQVALMLRFEPIDEQGHSLWATGSAPWSNRATLSSKVREAAQRGASAILIANPPGAADPRANELGQFSQGRSVCDVPVFLLTSAAAERVTAALDPAGPGFLGLRQASDQGRCVRPLGGTLSASVKVAEAKQMAANVGGLLPGRGTLANELIVIGAHLDHLGWGLFGSRAPDQSGKRIHPGADDNASGSAALLMLAERLAADYRHLPEQAAARSILILLFSAEESGLNGSIHYTRQPIVPLEQHALMMNFDMIGRMRDRRLSVSGLDSGVGLEAWAKPYFEASPLTVVSTIGASGGSDHLPFLQKDIPILFGIIADFHGDYHTPEDTQEKINRVDAVEAMRLWHSLALSAALRPASFRKDQANAVTASAALTPVPTPAAPPAAAPAAPATAPSGARAPFPVSLGIRPGNYGEEGTEDAPVGVLVESVDPSGAGAEGGLLAGDRLRLWNGSSIVDVAAYANLLRASQPGERVRLEVERGDKRIELELVLREPANAPR
jgi:hypothetical protein